MNKTLKVGIIGCGNIAKEHAVHYRALPDVRVTAICDIVPGRAEDFARDIGLEGVNYYVSYEEMFNKEQLDAVSVCTYNRMHKAPTLSALRHGACVLLEKPFASNVEEAIEMMRAEKESGKFISVGFQPRFHPDMRHVKEICESGELGKIYYIQTGGGRRRGLPTTESFVRSDTAGIGALGDIGCYSLYMVLNAVGYPAPVTVTGYKSDYFGKDPAYRFSSSFDVEDFAAAFIRLEGGLILDFRISWAMHPDTPGDTLIFGDNGALRIPSTDCYNENGEPAEKKLPLRSKTEHVDCFREKVAAFLDAVRAGGDAPVPTKQALINQVIINSILESAGAGHEIEVRMQDILSRI